MSESRLENRLKKLLTAAFNAPPERARPAPTNYVARAHDRVPAFKFAILRFGWENEVSCMIRDLSRCGARVTLDGATNLPEQVLLIVPQHGIKVEATVKWRRGQEAGLHFADLYAKRS